MGVAPGASHDEIKRAYLDRALKCHPDRMVEQSPEARARAEFHMRELNGAWEVLRNPGRRADYDARLRGDTPVWQKERPGVRRTTPVQPRVADLEPDRVGGPPTPGWRVGPVVLVVIAVVAVLSFAAWATASSNDQSAEVDVEVGTPYQEGGCVVLASVGGRITPVPNECSSIGALEMVEIVDLGRPCPERTEAVDVQVEELRLCVRPST